MGLFRCKAVPARRPQPGPCCKARPLRMLQREAEARIDDLQAHLKVIRYKIEFYQSIIDERELVGSPVGVTNSESHS